jgi:hypothetical protein
MLSGKGFGHLLEYELSLNNQDKVEPKKMCQFQLSQVSINAHRFCGFRAEKSGRSPLISKHN